MNRFRTKKKAVKEANEAAGRVSNDSDIPQMPKLKSSMTFKRDKKNVPAAEPKPEIDLSTALPSSDDFRTSLLMSGLSARFSMLREQDDPNSKIGKASDDSVLFPKRQSRLDGFNSFVPNGLSDIAEVASIRSSNHFFRPPFAGTGKTDSFYSINGYGTDDDSIHGSIMGRSKPGEGNNLFGGRQKVYHIPLKATGDGGGKGGMAGRARYDDDISQSAFQRFKDRERQKREHDEEQARLAEEATSAVRSPSPLLSGYNRNRETSSTTSSVPTNTRTSTAATSINSQGTSANVSNSSPSPSAIGSSNISGVERSATTIPVLERTVTKTRRLYETGFEKNLHEQQHSAMSRIDSLTRQQNLRSQTPPLSVRSPTSMSNLSDRFERHELSSKQSQASLRAVSPPPSASIMGGFEFGVKPTNPSSPQSPFGEPPLSPPMSEGDDALSSNLAIDAKDRGKATALGAFNKPAQPYDDMKYSERQMQMKAGREIPQKSRPSQPPPTNTGRNRAESNSTTSSSRSRSASSAQRQPFVPRKRIPEMRPAEPKIILQSPPSPAAFRGNPDRSRDIAIDSQRLDRKPANIAEEKPAYTAPSLNRPPESEHPANRSTARLWADFTEDDSEQDLPNPSILLSQAEAQKGSVDAPVDSPTLGPGGGLSGMVRQHMRSDSNASSFFGAPSPGLTSHYPQDPGNSWDMEKWKHDEQHSPGRVMHVANSSAVPAPLSIKSPKIEHASLDEESARPPPLSVKSPNIETFRSDEVQKPAYEKEILAHHKREGSTQTQRERETFASELAERRRRVQENLKSFAESDSRSNSPVPDLDWTKEVSRLKSNPLGILKTKSSRESMVGNMQVKSRRMLGLGNTTISSSPSPNTSTFDDDLWQKEEEEMLQGLSKGPKVSQVKDFRRARREERQASERKWIKESESELSEAEAQNTMRGANQVPYQHEAGEGVNRKASQESKGSSSSGDQSRPSFRAMRDRSNSSGRSKSRNGTYRDDLAKAMAEGLSSSTQTNFEATPASRLPSRSPTTPVMASQPMNSSDSRSRSNSRPPPSKPLGGYFDNHSLHPLQTGDNIRVASSPRPSPVTPFSANSTPLLTPVGSGANTPVTQVQGFQSQGRVPARKKTINKADISEPTLVSRTSQFDTVSLPPGASLKNGAEPAPPLPPINPRRRQTRIQTMVGVFSGNKSSEAVPTLPLSASRTPIEDHSTFSGDEDDAKKPRKLRKSSSEGNNLHARARQIASAQPSPALPGTEQGGMF